VELVILDIQEILARVVHQVSMILAMVEHFNVMHALQDVKLAVAQVAVFASLGIEILILAIALLLAMDVLLAIIK
jgi:hypothetical protein